MDQAGIKARLKTIIQEKGHTINSFSKETGFPQRTLSRQINEASSVGYDLIFTVSTKFTDVSLEWLIHGRGDKYLGDEEKTTLELKRFELLRGNEIVPLLDFEAAVILNDTHMDGNDEDIMAYISLPFLPAVDKACAVRGDSMHPLIKAGDLILYKWISGPEFITPGEIYLIKYRWDNDIIVSVKYIKRSKIPGCVSLESYNTHHEPIDLPKSNILALAIVKVSIRYNTIL